VQESAPKYPRIFGLNPSAAPWALGLFLAALTVFRLYYAQSIPLSEDEAYYWDWSRRLAWGYYDQGPMVAWLIRLGAGLFGHTALGVRCMAVFLSLGLSLLIYDLCRRLWQNPLMGLALVAGLNLSLLFTVGAVLMTYDTPQAFFWLLSLYCTARAVFEERRLFWYLGGVALGLAILSKYTSGLLPVLILLFLAFSRDKRHWLGRKEPWLASTLAGLIILPNLLWNAEHFWAAFYNTLRHTSNGGFKFTLFEFLGGQIGLVGPVLFGFLAVGLIRAWRQAKSGDGIMAYFLWTSLPVLLLFTLLSIQSRMQANWPAIGYLAAMPAAAAALWPLIESSRRWRGWGLAGLAIGLIMVMTALYPGPLLKALQVPKDANPFSKIYGWEQMAAPLKGALEKWPDAKRPFVFARSHQLNGLTAFYGPGQPKVEAVFMGGRLSQYVFWSDPAKLKGRDALGVFEVRRTDLPDYFERAELIGHYRLTGPGGGHLHDIWLYRCYGFLGRDRRPAKFLELFKEP
jgi:4-amino-4-deoxy-L-arabinose transferase-like glycosyltransferase